MTNMDMEDAIDLIKGKKGTEVRLTVRKSDNSTKVIPIVRDVIELTFYINLDGLTSVSASSINRQSITYSGEIIIPVAKIENPENSN